MSTEIDGVNGIIKNTTSDGDITIKGNDGGSEISALTLDMSDAGTATFNHDIVLSDDNIAKFGDSGELHIYHHNNGTSFIQETGSGNLELLASNFKVMNAANTENKIAATTDGAVELYHNNIKKFLTSSTGINLPVDGDSIKFGADSDVIMTHVADAGLTIASAGNLHTLQLQSNDDDANEGPVLQMFRNSSSPVDDDVLGKIKFSGLDGAGNATTYGRIETLIMQEANGSEDATMEFRIMKGGTERNILELDRNAVIINEDSQDIDFRVESNGNSSMLHVDAGNDKVGIGTNAPDSPLHIHAGSAGSVTAFDTTGLTIEDSDNAAINLLSPDDGTSRILFGAPSDNVGASIKWNHDGNAFQVKGGTGSSELQLGGAQSTQMVITQAGKIGMGNTSPGHALTVENSENTYSLSVKNNKNPSSSAPYIAIFRFHETPDNGTSEFLRCDDSVGSSAVARLIITSQGDVINHDNDYGQISDERIKDNIVDANSQWDDIKAIKVRNFERKDDINQYGAGNKVQIGVIAQEIEQVSPGLVKESDPTADTIEVNSEFGTLYTADDVETKDGEDAVLYTADDEDVKFGQKEVGDIKTEATHSKKVGDVKSLSGEKLKKVAYSVLYMKAIKALQEAQTRIETLETKVAALEG